MTSDARHLRQAEFVLAKRLVIAAGVGHADQVTAIVVSPSMIGASEGVGVAAVALTHGVAAMHTPVEHELNVAVLVARNDHRLQTDLTRHVVAGLGNLALMRDVNPFAIPDFFELLAENGGVVIDPPADAIALNQLGVIGR